MTCTFFGHRDTPQEVEPVLKTVLVNLIEHKNADLFYVGNHGNFDNMVRRNLKLLKDDYPHIHYAVVLAYIPKEKIAFDNMEDIDTIYPDGLENMPLKYAIIGRNNWMINKSDYVVCYVKYTTGGAAKFQQIAKKKGKTVLNLTDFI